MLRLKSNQRKFKGFFPVSPNKENIHNYLQAVKDRADIFVLIIGERWL